MTVIFMQQKKLNLLVRFTDACFYLYSIHTLILICDLLNIIAPNALVN